MHSRKANGDGGYTFLSMVIILSLSMVMVASLWTMVMQRVAIARLTADTSHTLQLAKALPDIQSVAMEEVLHNNEGVVANALQPYLVTTTSQLTPTVVTRSREVDLLVRAIAYQKFVESCTKQKNTIVQFNDKDVVTRSFEYGLDDGASNKKTSCTSKVLFKGCQEVKADTTFQVLEHELSDYSRVVGRLSFISTDRAKGIALEDMKTHFDILASELDNKAQFYIYTLCETKPNGSEVVYDRQISYQLMELVVSDDFQIEVSSLGSRLMSGEIGLQKRALCMERIP